VWKLFGPDPRAFFDKHGGNPSSEALREGGYITAVRDASIEVQAGKLLVIMGLSGSGKSTLLRCLSRLIEPTHGAVSFDGQDLLAASPTEMIELRRHKMGMVFQNFALFPNRNVLGNVAFPLEVQGIDRARREARAHEIIELVGLKGREGYYPRELSGGQQQRVGIARSLAVEPELWFLDEPFSALDPLIRREMQNEFLRLQDVLNKTIVFITHDFDEAIRLADRIAIMKDGEIIQIGTPEALVTNPATDYVAEFTKHIPRDKLLTVRGVMEAVPADGLAEAAVSADDKIAAVAGRIIGHDRPVRVIDADGETIGSVSRQRVVDVVFGDGA